MFKFLMMLSVEFNKVPVCYTMLWGGGGRRDEGDFFLHRLYPGSVLSAPFQ